PRVQSQFFAIIITCLLIGLYGTLLLEYDAKCRIEWDRLPQSPHIWNHQIVPRQMWPHTDMTALIGIVGTSALYAALWTTPTIEPKYRMYRNGVKIVMCEKREFGTKLLLLCFKACLARGLCLMYAR